MALVLNDRVKETTTTTGTGTINLAGAETGFESFVAGVGNSNTCYYCIAHQTANEFEVGLGTVTDASPDTLARTTIISSSNSDSAVDFSAGTKDVFCTLPASKAVFVDGSGDVGIGVSSPLSKFHIRDAAQAGITHTYLYDSSSLSIEATEPALQLMAEDSGTHGGSLLWRYGNNVFAAIANPTDDTIDFTYGVSNANDFQMHAGTNLSSYLKILSIGANGNLVFPDNGKAIFGAGTDLAIFSDGTNGKIEAAGTLILDADGTTISLRDGGTENSQIGLDSAGLVMTVVGADKDFFISGNDGGSAITGVRVDFSDAGHLICNGNITAFGNTSDIKLKENIEVISDALDKVKQLKGITFNYKKDGKRSTGLIAQDLEKVLPEAIYETIDADINGDPEDKHLAIRYGNTVGLLVEAIKEQQEQIETLNDYVKLQSASIMDMERRLNELENK